MYHLKNHFTVVFALNFQIRPLTEYAFILRPPQHFIGIFCLTKPSYNYEYSYITYENQSLMSYLKRLASPLFPPVTIFYNKHTVISTHTDFHTHTPPPSQSLYTLIRTLVWFFIGFIVNLSITFLRCSCFASQHFKYNIFMTELSPLVII